MLLHTSLNFDGKYPKKNSMALRTMPPNNSSPSQNEKQEYSRNIAPPSSVGPHKQNTTPAKNCRAYFAFASAHNHSMAAGISTTQFHCTNHPSPLETNWCAWRFSITSITAIMLMKANKNPICAFLLRYAATFPIVRLGKPIDIFNIWYLFLFVSA